MNCYSCHNGKDQGVLTDRFSDDELRFKILVDRTMPPNGATLNVNERLALYNCLIEERDAVGSKWTEGGEWMRKISCSDTDAAVSAGGNH